LAKILPSLALVQLIDEMPEIIDNLQITRFFSFGKLAATTRQFQRKSTCRQVSFGKKNG
jgi:hypothetical protein